MGKKDIINHGTLHDSINYDALIEVQANTPSFLDSPKGYTPKAIKNYGDRIKPKKLVLHKKSEKNDRY